MKKVAKYVGISLCIAFFMFLMLPFLEAPQLRDGASASQQDDRVIPQIFTSNPLTDLVKRVARFFKKDSSADSNSTQEEMGRIANAPIHFSADGQLLEATSSGNSSSGSAMETNSTEGGADSSFIQDENGEWVLIQQRTPETAHSGMHEISVKADAYERYVKQERSARFSPTASSNLPEAVPDSALAKIFKPIKRLFGFGDDPSNTSIPATAVTQDHGDFFVASHSDRLGRNNGTPKTNMPVGADLSFDIQKPSGIGATVPGQTNPTLASILDMNQDIYDAANMVADSLPSTGDPKQDEKNRQEKRREAYEKFREIVQRNKEENMLARAENQEATDVVADTATCDPQKGMVNQSDDSSSSCSGALAVNEDQVRQHNMETLYQEITDKVGASQQLASALIDAPMVAVLGTVDVAQTTERISQKLAKIQQEKQNQPEAQNPDNPEEENPNPNDAEGNEQDIPSAQEQQLRFYNHMIASVAAEGGCQKGTCFWVAGPTTAEGGNDRNEIRRTIRVAGFTSNEDPGNVAPQRKQQFIQDEIKRFREEEHPTPQQVEAYQKELEKISSPWILYNADDSKQLAEQAKGHPRQGNNTVIYMADAADSRLFSQNYGFDSRVFYGSNGHKVFTENPQNTSGDDSSAGVSFSIEIIMDSTEGAGGASDQSAGSAETDIRERSEALVKDVANGIDVALNIKKEIQSNAYTETSQNVIGPQLNNVLQEKVEESMQKLNTNQGKKS